jgi:hypothetical protein
MAQPDKNRFLSKLARFVSNPTTDWSALDSTPSGLSDNDQEEARPALTQAEFVALQHQRRKHNRNIRTQEFTQLRQVRAGPGISGVHSSLGSGSASDNGTPTAPSAPPPASTAPPTCIAGFNVGQIDHIEQQMTEQWWDQKPAPPAKITPAASAEKIAKTQMLIETEIAKYSASNAPAQADVIAFDPELFNPAPASPPKMREPPLGPVHDSSAMASGIGEQVDFSGKQDPSQSTFVYRAPPSALRHHDPGAKIPHLPLLADAPAQILLLQQEEPFPAGASAMQAGLQAAPDAILQDIVAAPAGGVNDLPESLNEPAILFVQGRNDEVEERLLELSKAEQVHAEQSQERIEPHVLLALLDFYRCTGQEEKFEIASIQTVQQFDRSAPQYRGADLGEATRILSTLGSFSTLDPTAQGNWRCPETLDLTDVMLLRSQLRTQPYQVSLNWQPLQNILDDAVEPLLDQFRDLAGRKIDLLMWGTSHLMECCLQKLVSFSKSRDAVYSQLWLLRLELARIMHGQQTFDQLALEYCVALEESPPSWARTRCLFIDADNAPSLLDVPLQNETAIAASQPEDLDAALKHPLQWQGTLKGNLQPLLDAVSAECQTPYCMIDCSQLDIMDYPAAAVLLKWLMEPQNAQRQIQFVQVNRLLAVFWRIMGITAKASVGLRRD